MYDVEKQNFFRGQRKNCFFSSDLAGSMPNVKASYEAMPLEI
jgi:hypothetical protein